MKEKTTQKNVKNNMEKIVNGLKIVLLLIVLILGLRLVDDRPPKTTLEDYIEKNNERMRQQENQKRLEDYKSLTIQEKLEYEQKINK